MGKLGWLGVLVLCASLGLHNGSRIAPVPLTKEFRLRYDADYASVGTAMGTYPLSYAFAQLAAGILTDRLGSRRLIQAGLLVMALARDRDFWLLFVGFAFVEMLAQTSVVSWMPTYLPQQFGLGVAEAGAAGALVAAGLIADLRPARRSAGLAPAGDAGRQRDRVGGLPAAAPDPRSALLLREDRQAR